MGEAVTEPTRRGLYKPPAFRRHGLVLLSALGVQIGLGIANVLLQLPLPLAVAHNTGAALLLCATLAAVSRVFTRNEARGRFPAAGFPRRFQVVR